MTLLEVLRRSTAWLETRGVDSPRLDAEILIAHALGTSRLDLYLQHDRPLRETELAAIRPLVKARGTREPVAHLVGEREFFSLPFAVDARVLVPRPETELLVEQVLARLKDVEAPCFVDVGTGSGCIAVAVLKNHAGARCHAIDVSPDALEVARANAERHGVLERIEFHEGRGTQPLRGQPDFGRLDMVVSNPPYIVKGDPTVEPDVSGFEPHVALFVDGDDPLSVMRAIAREAHEAVQDGGAVAFEVGAGSAADAAEHLRSSGYADVEIIDDLAGIPRVVSGRASSPTAGT